MRGMGKPAVTGARDLHIDLNRKELISKTGVVLHEGDVITLDGSSGTVFIGDIPLIDAIQDEDFITILQWADKYKNLHVLANADTPEEVQKALDLGAEGIGLCRMEHMFFQNERLHLFRRMILSETDEERKAVLHDILPLLRQDFYEMIKLMSGLQVTIRLLDPPIHEFFPSPSRTDFRDEIFKMSGRLGISAEKCETQVLQLQEKNPMLGCRGCRLSIIHSDILEMQIRSIVGGALDAREEGKKVHLQIMIPLVFSDHELDCLTPYIVKIALEMCENYRCTLDDIGFELGAMIEVPRACIRADKIATAKHIKFLSIGSNDLTQLTFGLSRDDTQQFMVRLLLYFSSPHFMSLTVIAVLS
jgi:pyruvate,orthophosphate dikinase